MATMPSYDPNHRFRLIVFDFDGTLVDSQYMIAMAMGEAFEAEGLAAPSREAVRQCIGLRLELVVSHLLEEEVVSERAYVIADHYRAAFMRHRQAGLLHEPLFDGVVETLRYLDQDQVLLAITTGKNQRGLRASLTHHGLAGHFPILKTADDGPGKPHPAILQDALSEAGCEPEEAVLIGDTSFDIEMACAAKVLALGAGWGYHDQDRLMAAGAARVLTSLRELPATLSEI